MANVMHRFLPLWLLLCLCACSNPRPQSFVLVSLDGLRADRTGAWGNERLPSPGLDALALESIRFERSYSQANESLYSHAALLTSRHVVELAPPDYGRFTLPETAHTLPEMMSALGYATGGFVAGGHLREVFGLNQGFETWNDDADFGSLFDKVGPALEWIDSVEGPFFLFLHGYDCHRPYAHVGPYFHVFDGDYKGISDRIVTDPGATEQILDGRFYPDFRVRHFEHSNGEPIVDPGIYDDLQHHANEHSGLPLTQKDLDHLVAHYDSGVLAADLQLSRFLDGLKARGLWDSTTMVVTSDHGEDLGDHGLFNHRATLRDSTTHVPLLIRVPGDSRNGTTRSELTQALDIAPTILRLAGSNPPPGLRGRDVLSESIEPLTVLQEGVLDMLSLRTESYRLVFRGPPLTHPGLLEAIQQAPLEPPWFSLFDLEKDPGEHQNLAGNPAAELVLAELRDELVMRWQSLEPAMTSGPSPDSDALDLLRSRGYWNP
jgi:choline-sulfatase